VYPSDNTAYLRLGNTDVMYVGSCVQRIRVDGDEATEGQQNIKAVPWLRRLVVGQSATAPFPPPPPPEFFGFPLSQYYSSVDHQGDEQ
jgi:hypothetical protein